ncbi:MAG: TonB-dependent receptor, partial [Rhizorhabdus sp.]
MLASVSGCTLTTVAAAQTATRNATPSPAPSDAPVPTDAQAPAASAETTASSTEQAAATTDQANSSNTDIVVTGSRIARTGMTAPTPITVFSEKQLVQAAPSTVSEALRTLPALANTSGPQRNPGTISGGQSFLDLRSLGASRTLTLVNGQRFATSPLTGSVDVNLIPAALIQRVEIVTGGASAAYGSDAVAGVVNFILDTDYSGVKADGYYGFSQVGENREVKFQAAAGSNFADGRGHFVVAGEYFDNGGARPEKRDWSTRGNNFIVGQNGGLVVSSDVRTVGTFGGLIQMGNGGTAAANASFAGIQFLPGGATAPYSFGSYRSGELQIGGDGINTELIQDITRPLTRKNIYGRAEYELLPGTKVYAEALYGQSKSDYVNSYNRNRFGNQLTIRTDNAYLPQLLKNQAAAAGVTSFTVLRYSREGGFVHTDNDAKTQRYNVGINGKIGSAWKWDAYYQHAFAKQNTDIENDQNATRYNLAADAVVNPATRQIVCRSTLTNPTNGCVPLNIFGEGSPSTAALAYVLGTSSAVSRLKQDVAAANLSGKVIDGWAGPISLAVGGEWRRERASVESDPQSIAGQYLFGNPQPWTGGYSAKEAYAETVVPLLRDLSFAKNLELNAAGRVTDYSTSGTIWSWKAGLSYTPFDGLRLRGTRSRDIRAPNSSELFNRGRT